MMPLVVVSDIHLGHGNSPLVPGALGRLVRGHPKHELVLAGDIFHLSVDSPGTDPARSSVAILKQWPGLVQALRTHVLGGGTLSLIPGNHDANLMGPGTAEQLRASLELSEQAPVRVTPWFIVRHGVHIEHGHVYDPDNAPTHPLAPWSPLTEPLGIALTRRFLAPTGAMAFLHAHETTPATGLREAFRLFGPRTPWLVSNYFQVAAQLVREAGHQPGLSEEAAQGVQNAAEHATRTGVELSRLQALLDTLPRPTHHDRQRVFMRLYFDRVLATTFAAGSLASSLPFPRLGPLGVVAAVAYLAGSVHSSSNRYRGRVEHLLEQAAHQIIALTGSRSVIFGHTHREQLAPPYFNVGSFTYQTGDAPGRPYAWLDTQGQVELRRQNLNP